MKRIIQSALLITLLFFLSTIDLPAQDTNWVLKYGKYVCVAVKYKYGSYEYIPRGSFVIDKNGTYTYLGFEKPSNGKFSIDKVGNLMFSGGYLTNGKAEKIDRPNKFFLVFPTIPDNRWTCTCTEK